MKRVADPRKPPVVVPPVVVAVDIQVPLTVVAVESGQYCTECRPCHRPSNTLEAESYPAYQMP